MDNQRPPRRRPSLLSEFDRSARPRNNWAGEQLEQNTAPPVAQRLQATQLTQAQLQAQPRIHQGHPQPAQILQQPQQQQPVQPQQQQQQQQHMCIPQQVVATGIAGHGFQSVVGLPHMQQVAVASHNLGSMHGRGLMGPSPVLQPVANVQSGMTAAVAVSALPATHQARLVSGQGVSPASPLHRSVYARQASGMDGQVAVVNGNVGQWVQQSPSKSTIKPTNYVVGGKQSSSYPGLQTIGAASPAASTAAQRVHERAPAANQSSSHGLLPTPILASRTSSSGHDGSLPHDSVALPGVEAVSPASVGEEESDNDSVDQMTKEQSDTDLAADCRKLNTPSPQIPVYSKEELMLALDRIDREINKGEQKLAKLKEGKKAALTRQNSQQDGANGTDVEGSFIDRIYAENKRKAEESHHLSKVRKLSSGKFLAPLYKEPSELAIYQEILRNRDRVHSKLLRYLCRCQQEQKIKDEQVANEYDTRMDEWLKKIEVYESNPKKKARDAKAREIFERHFPDLKRMRERTQRITRLGSRGTHGGARTEAELNEILDSLAEMDEMENPDRCRHGIARIPPMVGFQDKHEVRYVNHNSVLADPAGFAKEWQKRTYWLEEEKQIFRDKYILYPKGFDKIAAFLPQKSGKDCVLFYYRNKKTEKYKRLLRKHSKRVRQQQRLQSQQQEQERQFQLIERQRQVQAEERQRNQEAGAASSSVAPPPSVEPELDGKWPEKEIQTLKEGIIAHGQDWAAVAEFLQNRTAEECKLFYEKHGRPCHLQYALRTFRIRQKRQAAAEEKAGEETGGTAAEDDDEAEKSDGEEDHGGEKGDPGMEDFAAMPAPRIHDGVNLMDRHAVDLVMATASEVDRTLSSCDIVPPVMEFSPPPAPANPSPLPSVVHGTSATQLSVPVDDTPTPESILAAAQMPLMISPLSPAASPVTTPTVSMSKALVTTTGKSLPVLPTSSDGVQSGPVPKHQSQSPGRFACDSISDKITLNSDGNMHGDGSGSGSAPVPSAVHHTPASDPYVMDHSVAAALHKEAAAPNVESSSTLTVQHVDRSASSILERVAHALAPHVGVHEASSAEDVGFATASVQSSLTPSSKSQVGGTQQVPSPPTGDEAEASSSVALSTDNVTGEDRPEEHQTQLKPQSSARRDFHIPAAVPTAMDVPSEPADDLSGTSAGKNETCGDLATDEAETVSSSYTLTKDAQTHGNQNTWSERQLQENKDLSVTGDSVAVERVSSVESSPAAKSDYSLISSIAEPSPSMAEGPAIHPIIHDSIGVSVAPAYSDISSVGCSELDAVSPACHEAAEVAMDTSVSNAASADTAGHAGNLHSATATGGGIDDNTSSINVFVQSSYLLDSTPSPSSGSDCTNSPHGISKDGKSFGLPTQSLLVDHGILDAASGSSSDAGSGCSAYNSASILEICDAHGRDDAGHGGDDQPSSASPADTTPIATEPFGQQYLSVPNVQSRSRQTSVGSSSSDGMLVELHDPTSPSLLDEL